MIPVSLSRIPRFFFFFSYISFHFPVILLLNPFHSLASHSSVCFHFFFFFILSVFGFSSTQQFSFTFFSVLHRFIFFFFSLLSITFFFIIFPISVIHSVLHSFLIRCISFFRHTFIDFLFLFS